jgi:hypothetical protein
MQSAARVPRPQGWTFHPRHWRVRVRWVGFGSTSGMFPATAITPQINENMTLSPPARVLGKFDLPKMRVRLNWAGLSSIHRIWLWGLFALFLGISAILWLPFVNKNKTDRMLDAETAQRLDLIVDEVNVNAETIRIAHSSLDIGQITDLFDQDTETLARGLEANPFVLNFEFAAPKPVSGLVMDFGRMDFVLRVQVYGVDESQPVLYESEYRNQPPEPHVDLNFVNGPERVSRIYIEIEQLNPPDEPHIHVREVLFRE